ncbi:MAG: TetR/AcrR family transcriptional regulator [Acidobacteriota bacterium]|nr:TetR/AcrR family transcriptional regulator [Acidobacteriota bacterium]
MDAATQIRDPERSRKVLKQVGREVFAEYGFEGARTREIGARAALNKAMISYHFGGKQGLFTEILLEDIRGARARFSEAVGSGGSSAERLAAFVEALGRLAEERPLFLKMLSRELLDAGRHLEPEVEEEFFGFFGLVREVLVQGVARGEFRAVDPHATHIGLVGGLVWFALTAPLREHLEREGRSPAPSPTWAAYVKHYREFVLRGLASSDSPARESGGNA